MHGRGDSPRKDVHRDRSRLAPNFAPLKRPFIVRLRDGIDLFGRIGQSCAHGYERIHPLHPGTVFDSKVLNHSGLGIYDHTAQIARGVRLGDFVQPTVFTKSVGGRDPSCHDVGAALGSVNRLPKFIDMFYYRLHSSAPSVRSWIAQECYPRFFSLARTL